MNSRATLAALGSLLVACTSASATTYTLRADGTGDFATLAAAFAAVVDGDEVVLEPGTYAENSLSLNAGITLRSSNGDAATTVIDGEGLSYILHAQGATGLAIENVGFRRGYYNWGSGISIDYCTAQVSGCLFFEGDCPPNGPGYESRGSAAYVWESTATFSGCTFRDNGQGETVFADGGSTTFDHCLFVGNATGGLVSYSWPNPTFVTNCTFVDNARFGLQDRSGAGIIVENTIVTGTTNGPALDISCNSFPASTFSCCDVYDNEWGDWEDCLDYYLGRDGNVSVSPLFCDAATGDYTLSSGSPCTDAASGCGTIGAFGVGCGTISVESRSWSSLKADWR